MLLKVEEMKNKLLTFWNSRHLKKKKSFRLENFVNVHIIIEHLKISYRIGRSFHKLSRKSGGK